MKLIDYTPLQKNKKYQGKFLALKESRGKITVIAFGKDPKKVLNQAWAKGCKVPHLKRISVNPSNLPVFYNHQDRALYQKALDRLHDKNDPVVSSKEFWSGFAD